MTKKLSFFVFFMATSCRMVLEEPRLWLDPALEQGTVAPSGSGDPRQAEQWALSRIGLNDSVLGQPEFQGNPNVRVAILSSGVDYNHPELRGRIAVNATELGAASTTGGLNRIDDDKNGLVDDVVGFDFYDADGYAYDRTGTGTALAGIVAANANDGLGIRGVAPSVTVVPFRWYDSFSAWFSSDALVAALEAASESQASVVLVDLPVTLGFLPSYYYTDYPEYAEVLDPIYREAMGAALTVLETNGVPVVVGVGSTLSAAPSPNTILEYLATFSNVVLVTSSTQTDTKVFAANNGPSTVHTSAPGEDVLTLAPGGGYQTISSTAAAAAHVAGALALVRSSHPEFSATTHVKRLLSGATSDAPDGMLTHTVGRNRLNAAKLVLGR
jgi:large repetitive protein